MKKKKTAIWWMAVINCLIAIGALLVKDLVKEPAVTKACTKVLFITWLIQGIYLFDRFRKK